MKLLHSLTGSVAVLLFSLFVLGIVISPAGASPVSWQGGNTTLAHGHATGHHFAFNSTQRIAMTESLIGKLQAQGVDVSAVQTAIQNNDTAAVNAWFKSYWQSHQAMTMNTTHMRNRPGFAFNATARQDRLGQFVSQLQSKGVDVSAVQTAIQNNDTAAIKTWFASFFSSHPGFTGNTFHIRHGHWFNQTASKSSS